MSRIATLLIAALLFLTGCSGGKAEPTTISLDITQAKPSAPQKIDVKLGSEVTVTGTSEIDDVLHVHGYEKEVPLKKGQKFSVTFVANMAGVYEIETHTNDAVWANMAVK